jgi:hypothetical protein
MNVLFVPRDTYTVTKVESKWEALWLAARTFISSLLILPLFVVINLFQGFKTSQMVMQQVLEEGNKLFSKLMKNYNHYDACFNLKETGLFCFGGMFVCVRNSDLVISVNKLRFDRVIYIFMSVLPYTFLLFCA